jgi:hypothetical protein
MGGVAYGIVYLFVTPNSSTPVIHYFRTRGRTEEFVLGHSVVFLDIQTTFHAFLGVYYSSETCFDEITQFPSCTFCIKVL